MTSVRLNIERPDLMIKSIKYLKESYKVAFDLQQITTDTIFEGQVDTKYLDEFYLLGSNYAYLLFMETTKLILTGKANKVSQTIYQGEQKDGFLWQDTEITLLNNQKIKLQLSFLGFAESSLFEKVFDVMNNDDIQFVKNYVGIKEHHNKTSFIHEDYNVSYRIIEGNLLFFKKYDNCRKIDLDSIFEVLWTR